MTEPGGSDGDPEEDGVAESGKGADERPAAPDHAPPGPIERRPWLERIGLAAVAVVMGGLFSLVAVAAGSGGEWILAAMSAIGALMTLGVGLSTLLRG